MIIANLPDGRLVVSFTVPGAPRTKKNHPRRQRVGRFLKTVPSKAYLAWSDSARWLLKEEIRNASRLPLTCRVSCNAQFFRHATVGDADGFYTGLADVLQAAGIIANDKLIAHWDGSRLLKDAKNPRVEVTLTEVREL